MSALLPDLAADWLEAKALGAKADPTHSTDARRGDLSRYARAIATSLGHWVPDHVDLVADLGALDLGDLTTENLLRGLQVMNATPYASATVTRTLGTMRQWCRWMVRRGHLAVDPTDDEHLVHRAVANPGDVLPYHAFSPDEVDRMRAAAALPPHKVRSAWPARDVALVDLLAGCGTRAGETCALQVQHVELDVDQPLLRLTRSTKGGKRRVVPIPERTALSLRAYLAELGEVASVAGKAPLFVRRDGKPFDPLALDRMVRRVAKSAAVAMPGGAAAHAFRHQYGSQLALRDVPVSALSRLMGHTDSKTTAIYTEATGVELAAALGKADWL